jgi:hypothetical protein
LLHNQFLKQWFSTLSHPECEGQVERSVPACLSRANSVREPALRRPWLHAVLRIWHCVPLLHLLSHSALRLLYFPQLPILWRNQTGWQADLSEGQEESLSGTTQEPQTLLNSVAGMWHSILQASRILYLSVYVKLHKITKQISMLLPSTTTDYHHLT